MTINEGLRAVAGVFIVASIGLGVWVSPWFFAFTAFIGLNLLLFAAPLVLVVRAALEVLALAGNTNVGDALAGWAALGAIGIPGTRGYAAAGD